MDEEDLDLSDIIYKWIKQGEAHLLRKYLQGTNNPDEILHSVLLYNHSPLVWAVKRGREDMMRLLLQYGCDIEAAISPLKIAVEVDNSSAFTALCEYGANVTSTSGSNLFLQSQAAAKSVKTFKTVVHLPGLHLHSPNGSSLLALLDVYSQCGDIYHASNQHHLEDFIRKFGILWSRISGRHYHVAHYCISMGYYAILYALCKYFPETVQSMSVTKQQQLVAKLTGRQRKLMAMVCTKEYIPLIILELSKTAPGVCTTNSHLNEGSPTSSHDISACSIEEGANSSGDESDIPVSSNRVKSFVPSVAALATSIAFDKNLVSLSTDSTDDQHQ